MTDIEAIKLSTLKTDRSRIELDNRRYIRTSGLPSGALEKVSIHPGYSCIYHSDKDLAEFLYTYLDKDSDRNLTFYIDGKKINIKIKPSSIRLNSLVEGVRKREKLITKDIDSLKGLAGENLSSKLIQLKTINEYVQETGEVDSKTMYSYKITNLKFPFDIVQIKMLNLLLLSINQDGPRIAVPEEDFDIPDVRHVQFNKDQITDGVESSKYWRLVNLLEAAKDSNDFISSYIMLYVVFEFLSEEISLKPLRAKIRGILNSGDIHIDKNKVVHDIIDSCRDELSFGVGNSEERGQEVKQAISNVIENNASLIWTFLLDNSTHFEKRIELTRSRRLHAPLANESANGCNKQIRETIARNLYEIRNSIVHFSPQGEDYPFASSRSESEIYPYYKLFELLAILAIKQVSN